MQLTPYKKLLTMTKEAIDKSLAPIRANSAKKKAEYEVAKLSEKVAGLEKDINELCSKQDLDFDKIIDKLDDLALAERRMSQFAKIIEELFPDKE